MSAIPDCVCPADMPDSFRCPQAARLAAAPAGPPAALLAVLLLCGLCASPAGAHEAVANPSRAAPSVTPSAIFLCAASTATTAPASDAGLWVPGVRQAVRAWQTSLPPALRSEAVRPLADADRTDWHYTPRSRNGVSFKQMNATQREAAQAVLKALLSAEGLQKVTNIIELEQVLREMERFGLMRDPERYHLTLYGDAESTAGGARWGLRFEGHHLSLNFTFVGEQGWSDTPSFLGSNPATVPAGLKAGRAGLRVQAAEQDLARKWVGSLSPAQRTRLVVSAESFGDIVSRNLPAAQPLEGGGLLAAELTAPQKAALRALLKQYADTFAPPVAGRRMRQVDEDFNSLTVAWAGSLLPDKPHYYRIQGPRFLVEYDASQNGGNHIHTVWRDFKGDFGRDLLREHYQAMAGSRHGHRH